MRASGCPFAGMIAGALGALTPVQGALIQEAIDVSVILNALRALSGQGLSEVISPRPLAQPPTRPLTDPPQLDPA